MTTQKSSKKFTNILLIFYTYQSPLDILCTMPSDAHQKLIVNVLAYALKQERAKLDSFDTMDPSDIRTKERSKVKEHIKKMKKALKYAKAK